MKEFLSRAGHAFDVRNVDDDDAAYRELIALGVRAVPATVIGDLVVKGYDPERLSSALASAGVSPSRDR